MNNSRIIWYSGRSENSSGVGYGINGTITDAVIYEEAFGKTMVDNNTTVGYYDNHTLYAKWIKNE